MLNANVVICETCKLPHRRQRLYANQEGESKELAAHAVPIDTIEALTGLDLFAAISNDTEEATCDLAAWTKEKPKTGLVIVVK